MSFPYYDLTLNMSWDVTVSFAFFRYHKMGSAFFVYIKNWLKIFYIKLVSPLFSHETIIYNHYLSIIVFWKICRISTNAIIECKAKAKKNGSFIFHHKAVTKIVFIAYGYQCTLLKSMMKSQNYLLLLLHISLWFPTDIGTI